MIINHNMASLNTYRQLSANNAAGAKSLEKLSSGLRINRAGDDAAGLAISEKMRAQVRGLDQASRNAQDGISLIQTAEGGLNETHSILQRMRELAVQSANDTATSKDRSEIQKEVDELAKEITRISNTSEFNTKNLLAGGFNSTFHIGANSQQNISLKIGSMDAQSLGVAGSDVTTTFTGTATGITSVSTASESVDGLYISVKETAADDATALEAKDVLTGVTGATTWTGSSYSGAADANYTFRIDSVDGSGQVLTGSYSIDGGAFTAATKSGSDFDLGNGLKLQIATDAGNTALDTVGVSVIANKLTFKLNDQADGSGAAIGTEVTVGNNASSVIVGDASRQVTANFTFGTVSTAVGTAYAAADTDIINQTVVASTTAVTAADGSVTNLADTKRGLNVSTQATADQAITKINDAIETVSAERSKLGAMQNRLEHTITNLGTSSENLTAAESRVRDVDMAKEMMQFQKNNILSQAATAMLAQANQAPQGVLQLLR